MCCHLKAVNDMNVDDPAGSIIGKERMCLIVFCIFSQVCVQLVFLNFLFCFLVNKENNECVTDLSNHVSCK